MDPIVPVHVAPSTERKTEPGGFGRALETVAAGALGALAGGASLAAPFLPGGLALAGAVRGATRQLSQAGAARSGADLGGGDIVEATRALQQEAQSFNLQYLTLQESLQRESREFTALTNVMKLKHDTARSAIANIH
jgi:hypothetical protein